MIWGYDGPGYGPFRVNNFMSKANINLIQAAFDHIKSRNRESAFNRLKGIKGLGVSFISKIMYFAGKANKELEYPLTFDIQVANALVSLVADGQLKGMVKTSPINTFEAYAAYNTQMHRWARELDIQADQLEFFIF